MTDSTFKILLTTDNHLGFVERDPRRGDDSFTTFEEVLRAARTEHDVDFMLLGGDLFHENKPSLGCLVRACSLFRKYVYGNKEIDFSLLSDPATNFPTHALPMANFQDPNINVALPVFAIHGNHDDPVGGTSSLDLLATNGYLNYFGHVTSVEDIVVEPVLLRKGGTFIALYGLGNVRDERLHRCFRLKKVQFIYPKPVPGRKWFNILVVHQNRGVRGVASKNGILESMLAGFGMDLVIWGNEHEQLMVPQPSDGFDVVQPGSTVLTSLSAQECNPKQYGVLEVRGTSYRLTPYPLRSVRPVVRRTVELREDVPDGRTLDAVETFLHGVMRDMIREAEEQVARIPDDVLRFHPNLKYPLIRLAVDFTDVTSAPYPQPNFNRFGQQYMDVVANPGELLRPVKPKPERRAPGAVLGPGGAGTGGVVVPAVPQLNTLDIRVKVAEVFNHNARNACTLLSESELSAAVYAFAEKGERDAIDERLLELLHASQKSVWRRMESGASESILNPSKVVEEVVSHKRQMNERYARAAQVEDAQQQQQQQQQDRDDEGSEEDEDGRQRRGGTAAPPSHSRADHRHSLDAFETIRVAPHTAAAAAGAGRAEEDELDADGGGFGAQTNISAMVQQAIRRGGDSGMGATLSSSSYPASGRGKRGAPDHAEGDEEEDEGEELPGDGLDRVSLDNVIAQAVQQQQQQQQAPHAKRSRSNTVTPAPDGMHSYHGVHDDEDGDDDDVNGDGYNRARGGNRLDDDDGGDVVDVDGAGEMVNGRSGQGRRTRANTVAMGSAPATAATTKRQRTASARGGGAGGAAAGASSGRRRGGGGVVAGRNLTAASTSGAAHGHNNNTGGPTLTLMAHAGTTTVGGRNNGNAGGGGGIGLSSRVPGGQPNRNAGGSSTNQHAALDLLSKWSGGSEQQ